MSSDPPPAAGSDPIPTIDELRALASRHGSALPPEVIPIFERALAAEGLARRFALQKLGARAWYAGEVESAEASWRAGVAEGRTERDQLWFMALNNLSLILEYRARHFEAAVIAGYVLRHAPRTEWHVRTFAAAFRARSLLEIDPPRVAPLLASAWEELAGDPKKVESPGAHSLQSMEVEHALATGRWQSAHEWAQRSLAYLERNSAPAILLYARLGELRARYELDDSSRGAFIEELESLDRGCRVEGDWSPSWRRTRSLLRWQHAIESENAAGAAAEAEEFLSLGSNGYNARELARALGYLERMSLPAEVEDTLHLRAADAILERFHACQQDLEQVQELEDVTAEDWRSMAGYQGRLLDGTDRVRRAFAKRWRPGLPAYDHLTGSDGRVTQCAWCGRTRAGEQWLPSQDIATLVESGSISHGICPTCVRQVGARGD